MLVRGAWGACIYDPAGAQIISRAAGEVFLRCGSPELHEGACPNLSL